MKIFYMIFIWLLAVAWCPVITDPMTSATSPTVMDSYAEVNYSKFYEIYSGGQIARGQSFEGNGDDIQTVRFYIKKAGSPTGSAYAKIWASTGTHGTSAEPTGSVEVNL
jgi:hypothetical protein